MENTDLMRWPSDFPGKHSRQEDDLIYWNGNLMHDN